MQVPYWNVTITDSGKASINDIPVEMVVPNVYSAIYLHLAAEARQAGGPVLARGVDHTKGGRVAWFMVNEDGQAAAASPPQGPPPPAPQMPRSAPGEGQSHATPSLPSSSAVPLRAAEEAPSEPPGPPTRSQRNPEAMTGPSPGPQPPGAIPRAAVAPSSSMQFVQPPKPVPQGGFREAVYRATGGKVNLGPSQEQQKRLERMGRISRPLPRPYSTAFLSFKGGIGKTSTTVGVGLALAQMRGAPPVAIDANPDSGDLAERLLGEEELLRIHPKTITDLVRDIDQIRTWTDLSQYLVQLDRLHVVAGEQDPAVSDSLTAEAYARAHDMLRHFFSLILTDCGTGVTHNAMSGILAKADSVVIAAGYAVSGAKRAASTLDWLAQHGYAHLAEEALVVLTDKDGVSTRVQKDAVRSHLATHSRQVFVVPNDPAVADGDRINLERVLPTTREAWAEVAATLIDGYR